MSFPKVFHEDKTHFVKGKKLIVHVKNLMEDGQ